MEKDCTFCHNRGMRYGCRKCGKFTPEGIEQKSKTRKQSDDAIRRYMM